MRAAVLVRPWRFTISSSCTLAVYGSRAHHTGPRIDRGDGPDVAVVVRHGGTRCRGGRGKPGADRRGRDQGRRGVPGVEAQRKADATPVPKLSARAEAAVASLAAAANEKARAELWIGITADKAIDAELRRFWDAVRQRFGDDTVRDMLRSEDRLVEVASVPRQHGAAMAAVSRITNTLKQGEWASARQAEAQRLTQRQTLGYRRGLKP